MCVKGIFKCKICSGKSCINVFEPNVVHPAVKLISLCSERSSLLCLNNEGDPSSLGEQGPALSSPYMNPEDKTAVTRVCITQILGPIEEEVPNFRQCGDSDLTGPKIQTKESLNVRNKQMSVPQLRLPGNNLEGSLLLTMIEDPIHQLASLNQVGDYPSVSISRPITSRNSDSPNSPPGTNESITLPNIGSSDDQRAHTSTTAGFRWTQCERIAYSNEASQKSSQLIQSDDSMDARPLVPIRFSLQRNSEDCTPSYPSYSPAADPNMGHTSTTHEIRWTQIEQESLNTDRTIHPTLHIPLRSAIPESITGDTGFRVKTTTNVVTAVNPSALEVNQIYRDILPVELDETEEKPSTNAVTTLFDHSLPVLTENAPNRAQTLNELSWLGDQSHPTMLYISVPEYYSPTGANVEPEKEGLTSLAVQQSLSRHTSMCPFTCNTQLPYPVITPAQSCKRCKAIAILKSMVKHKSTQTTPEQCTQNMVPQSTLIQSDDRLRCPMLTCLTLSPPVGSEPPSVHIRMTSVRRTDSSICFGIEEDITSNTKIPRSVLKRSSLLTTAQLAPLRVKQYPVRLPVKFEPFEKLHDVHNPQHVKLPRLKEIEEVSQLDLNNLDKSNEHTTSSAGETDNPPDQRKHFQCVYVEVSLRRNLDSVPSPGSLTNSEARAVHILLDRKLQNAVATIFLPHSTGRSKSSDSLVSPTMIPALTEGGDTGTDNNSRQDTNDAPLTAHFERSHQKKYKEIGRFFLRLGGKRPLKSKLTKRESYGGAYVFTQGLRHIRPPKQWWDHIRKVANVPEFRSVAAWKIDGPRLIVGGLINYGYHLHLLVSSDDGRLGLAYAQAESLLTELVRKGTRYVSCMGTENDPIQRQCSTPCDSLRMFFKSPALYRLLVNDREDMSSAVGLEKYGYGISTVGQNPMLPYRKSVNTIVLYSKESRSITEIEERNRLLLTVKRLSLLSMELTRSLSSLKRHVMPVETMDYLVEKIRRNPSKLFLSSNEFFAHNIGKELQNKPTVFHGTLPHCIRVNAYCPGELHPMASDPDAFEAYKQLFDPILMNLCLVLNSKTHPEEPCYKLSTVLKTRVNITSALRYRVRFIRNLFGFGFAPVMSRSDFDTVENICKEALMSWKAEGSGCWYRLADMKEQNPALFNNLQRKHLLMPTQTAARRVFGTYRYWPYGRSVYVAPAMSRNCDLVVQINAEDHMRIICVDWTGKQPQLAYNRATNLLKWLDTRLRFSKSSKWGFLSPILENVGTGMRFSSWLKIPHLGANIALIERVCTRYRLQVCADCPHGVIDLYNVFDVAPISTIGRTEVEILANFLNALQRICTTNGRNLKY